MNYFPNNNDVISNVVYNNNYSGILLSRVKYIEVIDNEAYGNPHGIFLNLAKEETLTGNNFHDNYEYGAYFESSSRDSVIWNNTFVNNLIENAFEYDTTCTNYWNISNLGNGWSDYLGSGSYAIPGNGSGIDWHPWVA